MKKYLEKDSEFAYVFSEGDDLIIVSGEIGAEGNGKRVFAPGWQAETVSNMLMQQWIAEGFTEKPVPTTEIRYKIKTFDDYMAEAMEDKDSLAVISEKIADNVTGFKGDKDMIAKIESLIGKWGLNSDMAKLLAAVSLMPGSKKATEKFFEKYNIADVLTKDKDLHESIFYEIQVIASNCYADEKSGYPTKGLIKKITKMLTTSLQMFGYGIYPEGMKTMIRLFENDVVEGIGLDTYTENIVYNPDDYPYYDSIENEEAFLNEFWDNIDISELIK